MLAGSIAFLLIGFVILIYAGDCLVRGALAAAYKANISPLLVGILIVGFGTSMPEFLIAIQATLAGNTGLAHGNIIGSNIANIWLVLALPAVIFPISTVAPRMRLTAVFMLLVTIAWMVITVFFGLTPVIGMAFLGVLLVYAAIAWFINREDHTEDTPEEKQMMATPFWRMMTLILIGLVGLPLGSKLLVEAGLSLAKDTGIREEVVGLTLLAVGSSLPELGAGIAAAVRRQSDVAMGNILGANIFNILGVGGVVSVLAPNSTHALSPEFTGYSNWVMGLAALMITLVVLLRRRVGVATGAVFLVLYGVYILGLVYDWTIDDLIYSVIQRPGGAVAPAQ
ncbi:MAG TPA: sodium:calcium antiporter [Hyphomonadaceae bacterium]|jgi:cation:H+ antiporter|nr:sodium:calcium antiporter [Hyphomonadaceae bacterium]